MGLSDKSTNIVHTMSESEPLFSNSIVSLVFRIATCTLFFRIVSIWTKVPVVIIIFDFMRFAHRSKDTNQCWSRTRQFNLDLSLDTHMRRIKLR